MTRLAIYLQDAHPIGEAIEYARYAEAAGFEDKLDEDEVRAYQCRASLSAAWVIDALLPQLEVELPAARYLALMRAVDHLANVGGDADVAHMRQLELGGRGLGHGGLQQAAAGIRLARSEPQPRNISAVGAPRGVA